MCKYPPVPAAEGAPARLLRVTDRYQQILSAASSVPESARGAVFSGNAQAGGWWLSQLAAGDQSMEWGSLMLSVVAG